MKSLFLFVVALFVLSISAHAANPREELKQLVAQLQSNPSDTALREKIIKLAQTIKPALVVPEEARRAFVQGTTIAKSATDAQGQALAIDSFNEALRITPWWGNAYYNRAVAQDIAGRLAEARDSLRLYLLTGPGMQEAREAQDRIYALEAKEKMAVAAQNAPAAKAAALAQSLEGKRFSITDTPTGDPNQDIWTYTLEVRGNEIIYGNSAIWGTEMRKYNGPSRPWSEASRYRLDGLKFTMENRCVSNCPRECTNEGDQGYRCPTYGEIQSDGYSIVVRGPGWHGGVVVTTYRR